MTAPTNSLVDDTVTVVEPGDAFTATFSLEIGDPRPRRPNMDDETRNDHN